MSAENPHDDRDHTGSLADAYSPPGRTGGLRSNPVMLGALVILGLALLVFVVALALM